MTGKCIEFSETKGYGVIEGEDLQRYFCHFSAIQSDRISLNPDEIVTFEPAEGKRGKTATLVKHA